MIQRSFGGSVFDPVEESRDREITLGPVMLGVLGLALLALGGVCFISGYAVGRNSAPAISAPSASSGPSAAQLFRDQPKPDATPGSNQASSGAQPVPAAPQLADSGAVATDGTPAGPAGSNASAAPTVVHTAFPPQPASAPPVSAAAPVQSALPPAGAWMVQIAAVSQVEDADVLMSALRQRGYAVRQRRDPADNLIHVQVGPLMSENDAIAMRQRLLNDGYNAVIQH